MIFSRVVFVFYCCGLRIWRVALLGDDEGLEPVARLQGCLQGIGGEGMPQQTIQVGNAVL